MRALHSILERNQTAGRFDRSNYQNGCKRGKRLTLKNATRFGVTKLCRTLALAACFASLLGNAQDLAPRAYLITPKHSNAITLSYSYFSGDLLFDGAVPITGATAKVNMAVFSYTHALNVWGVRRISPHRCPTALATFGELWLAQR